MQAITVRHERIAFDEKLGRVTVWFCVQFAQNGNPLEFLAHIPVIVSFDRNMDDEKILKRALRALEKTPPLVGRTNGEDITHIFTRATSRNLQAPAEFGDGSAAGLSL